MTIRDFGFVLFVLVQGSAAPGAAVAQTLPDEAFFRSEGPLEIRNLTVEPKAAKLHETVEITFELSGTWDNPFNPTQVEVSAQVVGAQDLYAIVHGFLYRPYERKLVNGAETLTAAGLPVWKIRFAPWNTGSYGVLITVADTLRRIEHKKIGIKVERGDAQGFVSVPEKARYLQVGKRAYFPVGPNALWDDKASTFAVDKLIEKLGESGANFCRILMAPDSLALEWTGTTKKGAHSYHGLGKYSLDNAWRLDEVLDSARKKGVYALLCLGTGDEFSDEGWKRNPYSKANGGPCETPEDFWTDLKTRILYKKRLRYLISRYAHNSAFLGVQFWDRVEAPDYWLQEMANEVYAIHPYAVPITSDSRAEGVAKLERVNLLSTSLKVSKSNPSQELISAVKTIRESAKKPLLVTDVSVEGSASGRTRGPAASSLWSQLIAGAAGCIGEWIPLGAELPSLSFYRPLSTFAKGIDWTKREFEARSVSVGDDCRAWSLIDDDGGILYLEAKNPSAQVAAGSAVLMIKRAGRYKYGWIHTVSGETLAEGELRDNGGELTIPYPAFKDGLACKLSRAR